MEDKRLSVVDRVVGWGVNRISYARQQWIKAVDPAGREMAYQIATTNTQANDWNDEEKRRQAFAISWIFAAIRRKATEFSSAKSEVKLIQGEELISVNDHPQEILFRNPNPLVDINFIWQYTIEWLDLRGNGYWFLAPESGNENAIAEVWPVPADRMVAIPDTNNVVKGYAYKLNSGQYKFIPTKYVVHFMYPNPFSLLDGYSPLLSGAVPIETETGTSEYQRDTYVTGRGVPHSVITLNEDMGERDFISISSQIRQDFEQERKIIIARAGDLKVATVGLSARDMDLIGQRKFTRDELEILILGFALSGTSGSDFKEKYKAFKENTIYPLHRLLAGQLTLQLTQPYYGKQYITEFEDIRAQDRALNVQEMNVYGRFKTFNEARSVLKQGPLPEIERLPQLGDLPVQLATDPQFVLAFFGIGIERLRPGAQQNGRTERKPTDPNSSLSESDAPVNQLTNAAKTPAEIGGISAELDRLRKLAIKSVENDINAGKLALGFNTDILPKSIQYQVAGGLFMAKEVSEVKSVFEQIKSDLRGGGRGRRNKETAAVNKYQAKLEELYQDWYEDWADDIVEADTTARDAIIVAALLALFLLLRDAGRIALPDALDLAVGKDGTTPEMVQVLLDQLRSNESYLNDSLIPDLRTKLNNGFVDKDIQAAIAGGVGSDALASLLATATARVGSYAGAWWWVYQMATGMLSDEHGTEYRWNIDPAVINHCVDCLEFGDTTYPSFSEMLQKTGNKAPGINVACHSNCRCFGSEVA